MRSGFMSFRAPPAVVEQINYHNFQNMQPIVTFFQGLFKFMKRHILVYFSKELNVFCFCFLVFFYFL